jgi:hypothetical protein
VIVFDSTLLCLVNVVRLDKLFGYYIDYKYEVSTPVIFQELVHFL